MKLIKSAIVALSAMALSLSSSIVAVQAKADNVSTYRGSATGQHAVELNDGNYYWYHQSNNCNCSNQYNDVGTIDIGNVYWASDNKLLDTLGESGCAQYSLAMIASNLLGQNITLDKSMLAFGDNFNYWDNISYNIDNTNGVIRNFGYGDTDAWQAPEVFANYWGLECTETYGTYSSSYVTEQMVRDTIDKGGMVWCRYGVPYENSNDRWTPTDGHFLCIRNYDENGYYLLDSYTDLCNPYSADTVYANTPVSWDTLWNYSSATLDGFNTHPGSFVGFWNPNTTGVSNQTNTSNTQNTPNTSDQTSALGNQDAYEVFDILEQHQAMTACTCNCNVNLVAI